MQEKQVSGRNLSKAAQEYIEAHYAEKFSLQKIASALYVNGSYLLRAFRRQTGMTLLNYHHQVRCEKAKVLLMQTSQSISEIHFNRLFRESKGCTPSEFRNLNHSAETEGEPR